MRYPGYFCETGILLLALPSYIGDPDVIDHSGLVSGEIRLEPFLGRRTDIVIIPLDLTQLFCPSFTLAVRGGIKIKLEFRYIDEPMTRSGPTPK